MKAAVHLKFGSPEVIEVKAWPKPICKADEVMIKVHATTVNRTDCGFRDPQYFLVHVFAGWFKPKQNILGSEVAGVVEEVGTKVTSFKPGDKVFGLSTFNFGTHAEYVCIKEKKAITQMPANMTFNEAAAICDGAFLALANLKKLDLNKPLQILVNGATGSIGTATVQLLRYYGAEVTAVGNTKNLTLLKQLGADHVMDYLKEDFTQCGKQFDAVLDVVGKSTYFKCRKILKPKGIYISSELGPWSQNIWLAMVSPLFFSKKVLFPIPVDLKEDMVFFRELIEAGKYKAVIDKVYPLQEIVEATRYVETGEKTGNVVVMMSDER